MLLFFVQSRDFVPLRSHQLAARMYALTPRSFEEVALKFVGLNSTSALKTYLLQKLQTLTKEVWKNVFADFFSLSRH